MYGNLSSHTHSEKGHLDRTQVLCHCTYRLCVSGAYASVILASPCVRPPITFNHLKRVQSCLQQKPSFRLMAQSNDTSGCPMLGPRPIKQTRTHCQHTRHKRQRKAPSRTPPLPCVSLGIPFSYCTSLYKFAVNFAVVLRSVSRDTHPSSSKVILPRSLQ